MKQILLILALALVMPAFAEESKHVAPEPPQLSKEAREKMAQLHEKHAACLRSDKAMKVCHEEMKTNCDAIGDDCPMRKFMDHGAHGMPGGAAPEKAKGKKK